MYTRKIRRRRRRAICTAILLMALGLAAFHALHEYRSPAAGQTATMATDHVTGPLSSETETPRPPARAVQDDYLILVNADNPISADTPVFEIAPAYRAVPLLTMDIALEQNTLAALVLLFRAAKEAGIDNLLVNDGFRSRETQQRIYDEAEDKSFVQSPGHSEHETGLAVDIAARGVDGSAMGESPEGQWLAGNAWKYGFILRYPQDKQAITGIPYEPWHFRYVGVENAKSIHESGLCLEEYLARN